MRSSLVRSIQIVPRSSLPLRTKFNPPLHEVAKAAAKTVQLTIIDILTQKKATAADDWPPNLRIEPVVKKEVLRNVHATVRPQLKQMLREA
ncbi:MAG: hypothetical protein NXY57DRAFT_159453 [Lentinula lateritia]|uniref:Uncharacterized protein n=1 Tax=Lentinula lateritia TaxID=40482 RepID=A0ABQ8W0D1_9AGAR|nr:hypothetical protein EV359DRAFT_42844 [Lentinula novae-zelandiae]KAJ3931989.1 MAG: hypothetical protein NXY57DRAFT_159453 [Lentinula lateritia]KAJ4501315.1 hypothetical protein C8R41DRAFT_198983 [Lentinula lateritia]